MRALLMLRRWLVRIWLPIGFVVAAATAAHVRWSWMGFNPTDDGFVLAYTKRLLRGQVPHRDFISVRPVGSAFLHAPFVRFGGAHTFLVDRASVWVQLAIIAWAWTGLLARGARLRGSPVNRVAIALAGLALSAHIFPIMGWHTVDGLFCISVGLVLAERRRFRYLGYALVAFGGLCKQNFLFMAPLAVVVNGDRRDLRAWVAISVPPAAYGAVMVYDHALTDAIEQLTTHSDLWSMGWKLFTGRTGTGWRFAAGLLIGYLFAARDVPRRLARTRAITVALVAAVILLEGSTVLAKNEDYAAYSFQLFAAASGIALASLVFADDRFGRVAVLAVATAWAASISLGYQGPALASAAMVAVVAIAALALWQRDGGATDWLAPAFVALAIVTVDRVDEARRRNIYRDRAAHHLESSVADVFPGTAGIRTNANTRRIFEDLQKAIVLTGGQEFALLPDLAAFWVTERRPDPLCIDWPMNTEMQSPQLVVRVLTDIDLHRGRTVMVVQKFAFDAASSGATTPISEYYSVAASHVRSRWKLAASTEYFDIYR